MSLLKAAPLDFKSTWKELAAVVSRLVLQPPDHTSLPHPLFLRLHTFVFKLATIPQGPLHKPMAEELYENLKNLMESICSDLARDLMGASEILSLYSSRWHNYSAGMQCVNIIFDYLNRYWIKTHCPDGMSPKEGVYNSIWEMGLAAWRTYVQIPQVSRDIFDAITAHTTDLRNGGQMDFVLVRDILDIYLQLGERTPNNRVYVSDFASPFLRQSFHYYSQEAGELMQTEDCGEFVMRAHARISSELANASRYVLGETLPGLCEVCEKAFIQQQQAWLQSFFDQLLVKDHKREQLWRLFVLLRRVEGGLDEGLQSFQDLIAREGTEAIQALTSEAPGQNASAVPPQAFITAVMQRYMHFNDIVHQCFESDVSFLGAVDKGLVKLVNVNKNCAELLAAFANSVLSGQNGRVTLRDSDSALLDVIICLKYVLDKDVFQAHYAKHLAHRLINETTTSADAEESMIHAMRQVCTLDFISRLQRMLADKCRSVELQGQYDLDQMDSGHKVGMRVMVLTTGTWPIPPANPLPPPDPLLRSIDSFQKFYETKYRGRRLTWNMQLSRADVRANFTKTFELQVSISQLAVLLCFNDTLTADMEEISERTGIPTSDVFPVVASLIKSKVLKTEENGDLKDGTEGDEPKSGHIDPPEEAETSRSNEGVDAAGRSDSVAEAEKRLAAMNISEKAIVTVNDKYSNKRTKLKLPSEASFLMRKVERTNSGIMEEVLEDRRAVIQAVLVRIMKARKTLAHSDLYSEAKEQLRTRFEPSTADIKKNLDVLIEKEYIEREDQASDHPQYHYIA